MKKVGCLYRVSTRKQVYNNDIPVQREACLKFIKQNNEWVFKKEYIELGVSGYKITASERDVLHDIKKDVLNNEIDILLVFLFDRIGRKEEETPFVVEWLIENNIEVWSVNEGQISINNRYDKLINYITFWQAEGESEKISLRNVERRIQLVKSGVYMGNIAPYGYELYESDELSKIGKRRKKLKINPTEMIVVVKIFDLLIDYNYGIDKITICLNKLKINRRTEGLKWNNTAVLDIIRNPIYMGYVSFMKRTRKKDVYKRNNRNAWILSDKPNRELIIIPKERWVKGNELIDSRSRKGYRKVRLLSGLTKCGYCKDYITPKGKDKYVYMVCKGKQKMGFCEYTANYRVDILENIILKEMQQYLVTLKQVDLKKVIKNDNQKINRRKEKLQNLELKIILSENRIEELKNDIVKSLMQDNEKLKKDANDKFQKQCAVLKQLTEQKNIIQEEINSYNKNVDELKKFIPDWVTEFNNAPLESKRNIINKIIDKIYLYNDKIEICIKYPISKLIIKGN